MALFTDFFPTAGDQINTNMATTVFDGNTANIVSVTGMTVVLDTFAPAITGTIDAGDILTFNDANGKSHSGVVTVGGNAPASVTIVVADPEGLVNGAAVSQVLFSENGQTVIEGDTVTGGNSHTAGNSTTGGNKTVEGSLTVNGDIDLNGETITIGDDTATLTTTIVGNTIQIGQEDDSNIVNIDGTLNIDAGTADADMILGLDASNNVVSITAGTGLEFVPNASGASTLRVSAVGVTATHQYTSTSTTVAAALADVVAAFNTASTTGTPTSFNGVSIAAGTEFSHGDLVLVTDAAGTSPDVAETEAYIFTGTDTTASAGAGDTIATTDFADITHSGDVVERISATGNNNITIAGTDTVPTISLDLSNAASGELLFNNAGVLDGSLITQGGGAALTGLQAQDYEITGGNTVTINVNVNRDVTLNELAGGTIMFSQNPNIAGLAANTAYTIDSNTAASSGDNSVITFTQAGLTNTSDTEIFMGGTNTVTLTPSAEITIAATTNINQELTVTGDARLNGNLTVGTFNIGSISDNVNVQFNALGYNVASTGVNFNDAEGSTAGFNVNSTGNTSIGGNFTSLSGTGQLTLGLSSAQTRIAGSGIATTATNDEPLNLVVGSNGQVMTSTTAAGFDLIEGTGTTGNITAAGGDLVILGAATAERTLTIPSTPPAGTSIKISNLSATYATTTHDWRISGTAADGAIRIMNTNFATNLTGNLQYFNLDDRTASFEMVYTNATYGWVIIGAN